MREINHGFLGLGQYGSNFTVSFGVVKDNADPAEGGRLKVYVPAIDNKDFEVDDLPWAVYCSPFGGTTANFKVGREQDTVSGASTYGFWAIPKNGAQVLIGFLEGDPNVRFWMGCFYLPELHRTLPQSINTPPISTEIDESGMYSQQTMKNYEQNLSEAGLGKGSPHFKTRGGFEWSVSYPSNKDKNKPTTDGYYKKPLEEDKSDSQTFCFTSPGRHYWSMHDIDQYCRVRVKTTAGSQIILDDTNERIYISTARGRNWIEMDEGSGRIFFYTAAKFNVHSENDLNLYSSENINIVAKKRINIQSEERAIKLQAFRNVEMLSKEANIKMMASRDIQIKSIKETPAPEWPKAEWPITPPYSGTPLGWCRDYPEERGWPICKIVMEAPDGIDLRTKKQVKITGQESVHVKSNGPTNVHGQVVNIKGDQAVQVQGTKVGIAGSRINLGAGFIGLAGTTVVPSIRCSGYGGLEPGSVGSAGSPGSAESAEPAEIARKIEPEKIRPKMIVPRHEPWVRDEDEQKVKTPRNKSYQG